VDIPEPVREIDPLLIIRLEFESVPADTVPPEIFATRVCLLESPTEAPSAIDPEVKVKEPPLPVMETVPFPFNDPSVTIAMLEAIETAPAAASESVPIEILLKPLPPKAAVPADESESEFITTELLVRNETIPEDESVPNVRLGPEKLALAPAPTFNTAVDGKENALSEPALTLTTLTEEKLIVLDDRINVPPATFKVPENGLVALDNVRVPAPILVKEPVPLNWPVRRPEETSNDPLSVTLSVTEVLLRVPRVRVARLPTVSAPAVMVVSVPPPFAMRLPPLKSASLVNPVTVTVPPLCTFEVKLPPTVTEPPETFELKSLATTTLPAVIEPLEIEPLAANVVTPVPDKLPKTTVPNVPLKESVPNSATVPKVSDVPEKLAVVPTLPVNSAPLFTSTALSEPPLKRMVPVFAREPVPALKVPAVM